jgi:alpha-mannosidase
MQVTDTGALVDLPPAAPLSVRILRACDAPAPATDPVSARREGCATVLENAFFRVEIGPHGMVGSIHGKRVARAVLSSGSLGNRLESFEDRPVSWDGGDIDIFFEGRGEVVGGLPRIDIVEDGPMRALIEVERVFLQSRIVQRISLTRSSAQIDFDTQVDRHETHLLLKVAFRVEIRAIRACFGIQWGQIDRPTHRNTGWDAAQFELSAQKWADLNLPPDVSADELVNLLEEGGRPLDLNAGCVRVALAPCEIVTLRLSVDRQGNG